MDSNEVYAQMKSNIKNAYLNPKEISDDVIYCLDCKKGYKKDSHPYQTHQTVLRKKYYFYDEHFFDNVTKILKENKEVVKYKKEQNIKSIETVVDSLIEDLKKIKHEKINELQESFKNIEKNIDSVNEYFNNVKMNFEKYFVLTSPFYRISKENGDIENTIFLINYEMINLCDEQNKKLFNEITKINNEINFYELRIKDQISKKEEEIKAILSLQTEDKFDDYYWNVNIRIKKYENHIKKFRGMLEDVYEKQGSFKKVEEVVDVFDAKNKKGIDFIFSQEFFTSPQTAATLSSPSKTRCASSNKRNYSTNLTREGEISKSGFVSPTRFIQKKKGNPMRKLFQSPHSTNSSNYIRTLDRVKSQTELTLGETVNNIYTYSEAKNPKPKEKKIKEVVLSDPVLQRFFAYSILDLYNKTFTTAPERKLFDTDTALQDYNLRYNKLREYIKPVPKTNKISVYDPKLKKITYVTVPLTVKDHSYTQFPDGARSMYINGILVITGGVDQCSNQLTTVLSYDLAKGILKREISMAYPRAYHSIEYVDNYECLIVVSGRDKNHTCELFDLVTRKWHTLPPIAYPRVNANVVYNCITSDIYVLFGQIENNRNTDVVELLELKDVTSGWIKVDYYKNAQFDMTVNYCKVVQFSKDKLLIYGGNETRVEKKLYAMYLLDRNEIIRINNEEELEEIKRGEVKKNYGVPPLRNLKKGTNSKTNCRTTRNSSSKIKNCGSSVKSLNTDRQKQ